MPDSTRALLAQVARVVEDLAKRLAAIEEHAEEIEARAELVRAASRVWRVHGQLRDRLVLVSDAGDVAEIPVAVAHAMAAGRPLDLALREDGDHVELVDGHGGVAARVTRAAYLALPKALACWSPNVTSGAMRVPRSHSPLVREANTPTLTARPPRSDAGSRAFASPQDTSSASSSIRTPFAFGFASGREAKANEANDAKADANGREKGEMGET
jgi:hypothetical protein